MTSPAIDCIDCRRTDNTCPGHQQSDLELAAEQHRLKVQQRKRDRRGVLAANTDVLDGLMGDFATLAEVAELLGVDPTSAPLRNTLNRHGDELRADGWHRDTLNRRAVLRLAQIMRTDKARAITEAAAARYRAANFDSPLERLRHTRRCQAIMDGALEFAERVHDEDPVDNWQHLDGLDRHTLQALAVALGAMVQLDKPGATRWLAALPDSHGRRAGLAASGLAMIVPTA